MGCILNDQDRENLLKIHKKERDSTVADRMKIVLLLDDGWDFEEIAKALFLDETTVRKNFRDYEAQKRFKSNHKGSVKILNSAESAELSLYLQENIHTDVKDIMAHIDKAFEKKMSRSAVYSWLKANDFSFKKPILAPKNPDPKAQQEFIDGYEKLCNQASLDDEPILFGDAVHPTQETRPTYGWFKKKGGKILEVKSGRKRINIIGFHNLATTAVHFKEYDTVNGANMIDALKFLETQYPKARKIHVILDRAGYHTCKEVAEFLKTSRIKVHFLPPRSPNLNPIERLWKIMHSYVSNNRVYENFQEFRKAIYLFFNETVQIPKVVQEIISAVTDNFRVLGLGVK
jgi:transposase